MRLRLIHKALFLVAVPLAFELIVTGALLTLLHQSEAESKHLRHARAVIAQDLILQQLIVDCTNAIGYSLFLGTEDAKVRYRDSISKIPVEFDRMAALLADDPARLQKCLEIEGIAADAIKLQGEALDAWQGGSHLRAFQLVPQWKVKWDNLTTLMRQLVDMDRSAESNEQASEVRLRAMLSGVVVAGVLGAIALSVSLAVAFQNSTNRRLRVLMDNIHSLSQRQPLAPEVGGHDEIAELDSVFHRMVADLKRLERTKEEFLAMVSHDLRTPLTSILLSTQMWADNQFGEKTQEESRTASQTCENAQRLLNLVNTLLDMEKIESGNLHLLRSEASVGDVLSKSVQSVNSLAESRDLKIVTQSCDEVLLLDIERIVQVLVNLLSNAIKFSPAGSTVSISATIQEDDVMFAVADQGPGISSDDRLRVFDRFYQAPADKGQGTGLGLAICKKIIEAHGGQIGVESTPGNGSRFWFIIGR